MKKSRVCPKCGGKDIYTNKALSSRGERFSIAINGYSSIYLHTYICAACGFIEEYVDGGSERSFKKLKETWEKI